ncbi:nucleoside-diphosphate kinase [Candidatus Falkowbacteria bacterium]|nr:nucleoside-diphosphate kinase [Candidatus Falkowbacteria bacterium]
MDHPKKERTFVIIKPDGIQRTLIGEIIRRYERTGLKLVALKMVIPDEKTVVKHYTVDPNWIRIVGEKSIVSYEKKGLVAPFKNPEDCGRAVLERLKKYMTSGPVIVMVWQGNKAVGIVRKLTGGTEPLTSDVGTIRGDFTIDSYDMSDLDDRAIRNLIHASGNVLEAEKEISIWFEKEEIQKYNLVQEKIIYDVNVDGIRE